MKKHDKNNNSVGGIDVTKVILIDGQRYKLGFRGKVFTEREHGWVLSDNYTPEQIQSKLLDQLKARSKSL